MGVTAELRGFVLTHRDCGVLRGNRDRETTTGYRLWIECPCGARFERWLGSEDAEAEALRSALLAFDAPAPAE
jgi:hypothetical protein